MNEKNETTSELYLRFSDRSMIVVLLMILSFGGLGLAMAIEPGGAVSRWLAAAPWFFPVMVVVIVAVHQSMLRRHRWRPDAPEMKAIMNDEWRRTNLDRAMRMAFLVVLVVQAPIGFLLADLPAPRAAIAMGVATVTCGMTALAALFLFFNREGADGR